MGTLMQTHEDGPSYREMWYGEGDAEPWQTALIRVGIPVIAVLVAVGLLALTHAHLI